MGCCTMNIKVHWAAAFFCVSGEAGSHMNVPDYLLYTKYYVKFVCYHHCFRTV